MSKATFQAGLAAGIVSGMRFPMVVEPKKPVAYLYNGVELPDINEAWTDEVKETHPYAVIEYATITASGYHIANLIIAPSCTGGYSVFGDATVVYADGYLFRQIGWYDTDGIPTTWGEPTTVTSSQTRGAEATKWTSTDILNSDGTVYLAASAPIPVYE